MMPTALNFAKLDTSIGLCKLLTTPKLCKELFWKLPSFLLPKIALPIFEKKNNYNYQAGRFLTNITLTERQKNDAHDFDGFYIRHFLV